MGPDHYVFCMKWGTVYGAEDVNILFAMVNRNLTLPFQFVCFTDDETGINPLIKCLPIPPLGCEIPPDVPGKWPKVALWTKDLYGMKGTALFIDLDSVIVGNIDAYFQYGDPNDVITARNWLNLLKKSGQTSVFRYPIGGHSYMLENLQADSPTVSRKYQYEQNYVTNNIRPGIKFWPEEWTKHFRIHCVGSLITRYLRPPIVPAGAKIITFPGKPKPSDAAIGRWSMKAEARTPREHLKWVWEKFRTGKPWWKHLSRFFLPADWVKENWRE